MGSLFVGRAEELATLARALSRPPAVALVEGEAGIGKTRLLAEPPTRPARLRSVQYLRPVAHLKHAGSFAQIYYGTRAERDGYDDALLVGADGTIAETTIANIAFVDGGDVIWPDAPALAGITMQLLESRLVSRRRVVRLSDLTSVDAAFLTNSRGVTPVGQIDDVTVPVDERRMRQVVEAYEAVPWDPI